jgi:hypothetical protein
MTEMSLELILNCRLSNFLNFLCMWISLWFHCLYFNVYFSKYSWIYAEISKLNILHWFFDTYTSMKYLFFSQLGRKKVHLGLDTKSIEVSSACFRPYF